MVWGGGAHGQGGDGGGVKIESIKVDKAIDE